jgi:DNA-binding NtrC family response regulator
MSTVLYVDDQPAMARAVERWLRGRGTGVHAARTIAEAKRSFAAGAYDGVFIDMWLHDGSGFELYDWILEHRPALADRVAFVTADIMDHGRPREQLRLIDRPVFVKPFDLAELDRCVERWITADRLVDAVAPAPRRVTRQSDGGGIGRGTVDGAIRRG